MKFFTVRLDLRISLLYALFGGLWILFSDRLLAAVVSDISQLNAIQTYKGWGFVACSAMLIFLLLRNDMRAHEAIERKLDESEARLRMIYEMSPEPIGLLDADANVILMNPAAVTTFGFQNMEEMRGKNALEFFSPEDRGKAAQVIAEIQNSGIFRNAEFELFRKDGTRFSSEFSCTALNDTSGKLEGIIVITHDITERKQVEDQLHQNEIFLRQIIDLVPHFIFAKDKESRFLLTNKAVADAYKTTTADIVGKSDLDFSATPEEARHFHEDDLAVIESGAPRFIPDEFITDAQGNVRHLQTTKIPFQFGPNKLPSLLGVSVDITERKRAEKELHESEERYRILFENMQEGYAYCKMLYENGEPADFMYIAVNEKFELLTGLKDVTGKCVSEVIPNIRQSNPELFAIYSRVAQTNQPERFETFVSAMDMWFSISVYSPAKEYFVAIFDVVTERKRAEEALRESEERFRTFIEQSSDGIAIYDQQGKVVEWNRAQEQITGLPYAQAIGTPVWEIQSSILLPEHRITNITEHFKRAMQDAIRTHDFSVIGKTQDIEIQSFSGERKAISQLVFPIETERGISIGSIARDVTEQLRAERIIREDARQMNALVTSLDDIVFELDEHATYLNIWTSDEHLLAKPKSEMLGKTAADILGDELARRFVESIRRVIEGGHVEELTYPLEVEKGKRWFLARINPIYSGGELSKTVSVLVRDITERKYAHEALQRSEEKYRNIFENSMEAITQTTPDGKYLMANPRAAHMLGFDSPDDLIANSTDIERQFYVNPNRRKEFISEMQEHEVVTGFESEVYRRDGSTMWITENSRAKYDENGAVLYYEGTAMDITERKRAEEKLHQQIERLAALNEIGHAISSSFELHLSLSILLLHAVKQLKVDAVDVLMFDPSMNALNYVIGRGFSTRHIETTRLHLGNELADRLVLEQQMVAVPDVAGTRLMESRDKLLQSEAFVSYDGIPLIAKGKIKGVLEIFQRTPLTPDHEWLDYLKTLAEQAALAIDNNQLFEGMQRSNIELQLAYDNTIEGWSRALDLRDKETEGHTRRVVTMTIDLARLAGMGEEDVVHVRRGALLHDIGKMGVPDSILLKPAELTDAEREIMRHHPRYAYDLLLPIEHLHKALDIPYCHHEKWDGTGYPRGLKGEQIPLSARLFAVVDVWDALCSDRPYRKGWPKEKVLDYIRSISGTYFDPHAVDLFFSLLAK
jgi:PAS domain S-box-containing protein